MAIEVAIIGGTGVYDPRLFSDLRDELLENEYGTTSVKIGLYKGKEIAFLNRHGAGHSVPPHLVNYRANIKALKDLGVQRIFATAAVGSLKQEFPPGAFVLVDQFLDFTKQRESTFFTGGEKGVIHIDMTEPYCPHLREIIAQAASRKGIEIAKGGVYVCTEGPRFETPAEIRMYRSLGGDLVGMTSVPEVVLAREAEICYATIAMVTNFAAGISPTPLTHTEVLETMAQNASKLQTLLLEVMDNLPQERNCSCGRAISDLGSL
ncbi:5'-methylthioadenosine phosphorylase [Carboxydocella sporoproducens DSM 16521]|uniref:Probable 6-oxopurine nucleoside phosphorylase n=2 Tax=Carboxydocella TaxID=178898 RepID=A0A1T4PWN7_9FIRM|nr:MULTISPECIES: S-methyl-5'-thioadenosine phosphorylase [Carboxydocella]AVX20470.1 methylthioadenosine phosphorylase [Carboxydocella thermautotrophica]AVX30891.1 methylthioadenosine phosphorylase [Carboxydocella thermautotrophica]GAW29713.1 methylthioadenosine phosphorylase [Carboxydocella sp. ULO1]SJZ95912.1 5'-methylthioadenosine phosphorylase [Carboxydocella sporoproducens DSM 16521]